MTYNTPDRIEYVERHAGTQRTREWALKAARHYRRAVLSNQVTQPEQRRLFVQSYLALKKYALGVHHGSK